MRLQFRHHIILTLTSFALLAPVANAQVPIDPTLGPLTTLKDSLGFSVDLAQSKIGLHIKRPALEQLMKMKYGPSYVQYGSAEDVVQASDIWAGIFTALAPVTVKKVWQKSYLRNLALDGSFDVPNQTIPIKLDMKTSFWANYTINFPPTPLLPFPKIIPFSNDHIADMTADLTGNLKPTIDTATGDFLFKLESVAAANTTATGKFPAVVDVMLFPLLPWGTSPGLSLVSFYGLTHWSNLLNGIVADSVTKKAEAGITVEQVNLVKNKVNEFCQTTFGLTGTVLNLEQPVIDSEGLWLYFSYDVANLQQVFDQLIQVAKALGILEPVEAYLQAQNLLAMAGFDLTKFNTSKDTLIIGLAGAGVYPKVVAANQGLLQTYATAPTTPIPTHDDGTYPLPANYVDAKTIAVVGTPWLNSVTGSLSSPDSFWGPDPAEFAAKIKTALGLMAPNSRLILVGKSMGGCRMQQVVEALKVINVNVDLLVLVDGSCMPADQSGVYKNISSNVERVYNFRQTMAPPNNNNQNGFQLQWGKPTIGYDVVVSDEALTNPMCPGVGHDGIDECAALLAEIDRIIKSQKTDLNAAGMPKLAIWSWNEAQEEANVIKPRVYVQNNGDAPVSNLKVYSYFSVEPGMTPALQDWYSPGCTPSLEKIGPNNYRVVYDYTGVTILPGSVYPNYAGSVVGIYYTPNWPVMDKSLNYSYSTNASYAQDKFVDVRLENGTYIFNNAHAGSVTTPPVPGEVVLTANGTVTVPPQGVKVRVQKPSAKNGLMFTVRNTGTNDYTKVEWYGVLDQNLSNCSSRTALLSGNGAQINNIATPKAASGETTFVLKSQNTSTYSVMVEIFDWSNGAGCSLP